MEEPKFTRFLQIARTVMSWSAGRFALAGALIAVSRSLPPWPKGIAWAGVFALGVWGFVALRREVNAGYDLAAPRVSGWWAKLSEWEGKQARLRNLLSLCGVAIFAVFVVLEGWEYWKFMATSSLREDEIMNVATTTSRGVAQAASTYDLARNHIFFNVLNGLLPWGDSTLPIRARVVSFAAVLAMIGLLIEYGRRRGWLVAAVACSGMLLLNVELLKVILEARGYGLISCFALLGCVALTEWLRTGTKAWLITLATTCVLGAYTLPFYLVFGGGLMLAAFAWRPSRETLLTGVLTLAAMVVLYLPVAGSLWKVSTKYADVYGDQLGANFNDGQAVFRSLEFFITREVVEIDSVVLAGMVALVVFFLGARRCGMPWDRQSAAGITAAVAVFLAFCLLQGSPPLRIAAFLAAPVAFLATMIAGSVLATRGLTVLSPLPELALLLVAGVCTVKVNFENDLMPRQDWRTLGKLVDGAFPEGTRLWVAGSYHRLLEWNLHPRRNVEKGVADLGALGEGELVAVEGYFKMSDGEDRMKAEALPKDSRFVTVPLLINYQRAFFVSPAGRGISSIEVAGKPVASHVAGWQPIDPWTLARSRGHGDLLTRGAGVAEPERIGLPATLEISLEPGEGGRTCSLLFSQTLADKKVSATIPDGDGWRDAEVFCAGEMAIVTLGSARQARVKIEADENYRPLRDTGKAERPEFGLIEAWTTAK